MQSIDTINTPTNNDGTRAGNGSELAVVDTGQSTPTGSRATPSTIRGLGSPGAHRFTESLHIFWSKKTLILVDVGLVGLVGLVVLVVPAVLGYASLI